MKIQIEGLDRLQAQLAGLGFSDRRFRATVATALTRTAHQVRQAWQAELRSDLDRPTPLTTGAPRVQRAEAGTGKLQAEVSLRDSVRAGGVPPSEYLLTQERGGDRRLRKFERALVAAGAMPAGHKAVPGEHAERDAYGNVSRRQIIAVLNQLAERGSLSVGYRRVTGTTAARRQRSATRHGRRYVAITQAQGRLHPGVYEVRAEGGGAQGGSRRTLRPVFFFVASASYRRRTDLIGAGRRTGAAVLEAEMRRAVDEQLRRLAARSA